MSNQQECFVKMYAATGQCQRETHLNKAGKPVVCGRDAYARLEDGSLLCHNHMQDMMEVCELELNKALKEE